MMNLNLFLKSKKIHGLEGHIQNCNGKIKTLKELVNSPGIVNVMEIGFNAGHSAEIFLSSNPNITLTSFDIGYHKYVAEGKKFIDGKYPNRHTLIIGDSQVSVPEYIKNNPDKKFDLIFIDGGHTYEIAKNDLYNCKSFAHKDTIVMFDDTMFKTEWTQGYNIGPTAVWKEAVENNYISEIKHIDYELGMGMSWAKYN